MTFRQVLARWWFLTLPGLILTPLVALAVALLVAPEYQATATLIVLGPNPPARVSPTGPLVRPNPYLGFGRSLDVAADLIVRIMANDPVVRQRMRDAGATAKYDLSVGTEGGPMINVLATSRKPADALTTAAIIDRGIQDILAEHQKQTGAPADTWIRAQTITASNQATLALASPIRAFIALAALGLAAVVGLAYLLQALEGWPDPLQAATQSTQW
jgi:hypothetical protein